MPTILNLFSRTKNTSFLGATFNSKGLNLTLFKDEYPLCWAQEHLTPGVVIEGRVVDKEQFGQVLNMCIERCLSEQSEEKPGEVLFGVGGNNCTGVLTTARQKRDLQEKISQKALTSIYKEVEQNGLDIALEEVYQLTGNEDANLESVLNETVSIKLDNTVVFDPIDQSCELLELELYNAYCTPDYIDFLEEVAKGVKLRLGGVFPLQYLLARSLKAKLGDTYDATLINVHNDFTDISVVFGGGLIKNKVLPLGSDDLEKDLDFWMDGLELAFADFSNVKTFANNVYVCGSGLERTDFWEMMEWREWEEKIPFKAKPIFTKLDASYVGLPQDYKGDLLVCGLLNLCKELL